jgi:hypothetical protein
MALGWSRTGDKATCNGGKGNGQAGRVDSPKAILAALMAGKRGIRTISKEVFIEVVLPLGCRGLLYTGNNGLKPP